MMEKIARVISSVSVPLGSFVTYWLSIHFGDDSYSGTDLFWGVLVTIILMVAWYLHFPLSQKIERFSIAWILGGSFGVFLFITGFIFGVELGYPWGDYMWFFGLWTAVHFYGMCNKHKPYPEKRKLSFFKNLMAETEDEEKGDSTV